MILSIVFRVCISLSCNSLTYIDCNIKMTVTEKLKYFNDTYQIASAALCCNCCMLLFSSSKIALLILGEKQAATHVSLDQEYDLESSQQWKELEEQVVSVINKGIIPSNFQPTQFCLNRYSDNSRFPLAVVEGKVKIYTLQK